MHPAEGTHQSGGTANSHRNPLTAFRRSQRVGPYSGHSFRLPDMFQPGTLLSFRLQGFDPSRDAESSPTRSSHAVSDFYDAEHREIGRLRRLTPPGQPVTPTAVSARWKFRTLLAFPLWGPIPSCRGFRFPEFLLLRAFSMSCESADPQLTAAPWSFTSRRTVSIPKTEALSRYQPLWDSPPHHPRNLEKRNQTVFR